MALEESDCMLLKMLKLVEAEELGERSVRDTKTTGEMGRISTDDTAGPQGGDATKTKFKKCGRWASHPKCPALGQKYLKCQENNQFARMCPSRRTPKDRGSEQKEPGVI